MRTIVCDMLGIDVPIFAFTHCRDVVVEVSKAGGLGVLGMVGFTPEQVKEELDWIDAHIGDKPYGVDIVIPQKYEGMGATDPKDLERQLKQAVPQGHFDFAEKLLNDHGVPAWPDDSEMGLLGWTEASARPQLEEALRHPKVRLVANALGTPPAEVIAEIKASGRLVAALCGKIKQGLRHKAAGVDIVIAQGHEGGGHTGEIGSVVLWPQMVDALAPTPVLAAGGVGNGRQMAAALAMGCAGVWTGSLWLPRPRQSQPIRKACYVPPRRTQCVPAPGPASRRGCSRTTGPRPGRIRPIPSPWACRCRVWSAPTRCAAPFAMPVSPTPKR